MSNEFGYIPESPEQSFGNNKGIFTPTDIYDLTRADKYTNYGQLELIETQTVSSAVAQVDFTSIQESTYNVHFLTANNVQFASTGISNLGIRFFNSGSVDTSGYQMAYFRISATGSTTETKSTNTTHIRINTYAGGVSDNADGSVNGYSYFYNLGDSTKYSFHTKQTTYINYDGNPSSGFGSGTNAETSVVDGIRLFDSSGAKNIVSGTFSLYGIKEYS
jgi:hypothetical protein